MRRCVPFVLGIAVAASWLACTQPLPPSLVIRGATILDGTGGPPIEGGVVVIRGERIVHVGPAGSAVRAGLSSASPTRTIDARGMYLLPGLADMHHHLGTGAATTSGANGKDDRLANLEAMLGWGFTAVFEPGSTREAGRAVQASVAADPTRYPHYWSAGPYIAAPGGWGALQGGIGVRTPAEARAAVAEVAALGVDAIKIVYDDMSWLRSTPFPQIDRNTLVAAIDEAHRRGLRAFAHAPILDNARTAVAAGIDGLVHGVLTAPLDDALLTAMREQGTAYVATLSMFEATGDLAAWVERQRPLVTDDPVALRRIEELIAPVHLKGWESWWDRHDAVRAQLATARDNLRRAYEADVSIVIGTDTGVPGVLLGASSHLELQLHAEAGLTNTAVLQAATRNAAWMLGRSQDLGTIEAGKIADLLLVEGDPRTDLANLRKIRQVIRAGQIVMPR